MELKHLSGATVVAVLLLNIFGWFWCCAFVLGVLSMLLGMLMVLYLQHDVEDSILKPTGNVLNNPLEQRHTLGLDFDIGADEAGRKQAQHRGLHSEDRSKWRPFETIKVYTERRKSHDCDRGQASDRKSDISIGEECFYTTMPFQQKTSNTGHGHHQQSSFYQHQNTPTTDIPNPLPVPKSAADAAHESSTSASSSPHKHKPRSRTMFTGYKPIDQILHTMIDFVLRDYVDSWFSLVSDNTEFSEVRTRSSIEESVHNACARIKNTEWIPLITTNLADDIATHTRIYRRAGQAVAGGGQQQQQPQHNSPHRRGNATRKADTLEAPGAAAAASLRHRRNKSDTDLSWHIGSSVGGAVFSGAAATSSSSGATTTTRNVANSKFYAEPIDEQSLFGDAESRLTAAFFDISGTWRDECMDDKKLEEFLTHAAETILYFTIPDEDFACLPLRHFLSALLANVVCRPLLDLFADPDFLNLQLARLVPKESINSEYFIKLTRQCTDLSELRACRQFVVREMDALFKESNTSAELNSLKYTQKLIDMRLSYLQSNKSASQHSSHGGAERGGHAEHRSLGADMPLLTLEELLTKELALSYYLDYLSILNLQKYVIFYLTAIEWKITATRCILDIQANTSSAPRDEILAELREKAAAIHGEYLNSGSSNYLQIDRGLIEALHIKTSNVLIVPENTWFDSICKFVYEKLKNEDVFLAQFYQSAAYKKLLLELEFCGQTTEPGLDFESSLAGLNFDTSSADSNSADIPFDEDEELAAMAARGGGGGSNSDDESISGGSAGRHHNSLGVSTSSSFKHSRSHSDCTGIFSDPLRALASPATATARSTRSEYPPRAHSPLPFHSAAGALKERPQRVHARIINTAILCDGQYAVYAIEVSVVEADEVAPAAAAVAKVRSWHVYRRYSKFLELKKLLVKRSAAIARIPFPAKKTFQNTDRAVLEHRMVVLNEFLRLVCQRAEDNPDIHCVVREFMEPDNNDRKMHGGAMIKTIETIVNPIKSGMRTIKNMPDTLVGGIAKILLGRGPMKQSSFLDVMPAIEHSCDYPALTSALNLLDEVFDLQARSQWLRRGIINRLLGAPWVSHATNKKIIHATKAAISAERIESVMSTILNTIWPNSERHRKTAGREDNTKLRTRMAAKIALLSLLADDLKHVVGSETTRSGLLSLFGMLQNRRLNRRLALVIFNHVMTAVLQVDSLTKHTR